MKIENRWSWDCEPVNQLADVADCLTKPWPSNFKGVSLSVALGAITKTKLCKIQTAVLESQDKGFCSRATKLN